MFNWLLPLIRRPLRSPVVARLIISIDVSFNCCFSTWSRTYLSHIFSLEVKFLHRICFYLKLFHKNSNPFHNNWICWIVSSWTVCFSGIHTSRVPFRYLTQAPPSLFRVVQLRARVVTVTRDSGRTSVARACFTDDSILLIYAFTLTFHFIFSSWNSQKYSQFQFFKKLLKKTQWEEETLTVQFGIERNYYWR